MAAKYNTEGPAVLKNACLEACLVHARLLIEFVAGRPQGPGRKWNEDKDLTPRDFNPAWQPSAGVRLDGYLELIDKNLAHLSKARVKKTTGTKWALGRIVNAILVEFANLADAFEREGVVNAASIRVAVNGAWNVANQAPGSWPEVREEP